MPKKEELLTETELELISILWKLEEANVKQVMEELPSGRELAYTSVSTIIRIMEKKGFVKSQKQGRGHIYSPTLSKEEYEARSLGSLVENVFDGAPVSLVRCLVEQNKLSKSELDELKKLLKDNEDA